MKNNHPLIKKNITLTLAEEKISIFKILPDYTVLVGLPILPSIASFFFRQFVHRKGPSHGFEEGEKKGPELTDKPSPGG